MLDVGGEKTSKMGRKKQDQRGAHQAGERPVDTEKSQAIGSIAYTSFPGRDKRPERRRRGLRTNRSRQRQDQEHSLSLDTSSTPHHNCPETNNIHATCS